MYFGNFYSEYTLRKPNRPLRVDRRAVDKFHNFNGESLDAYKWVSEKMNFLFELLKFLPAFENSLYAGDFETAEELTDRARVDWEGDGLDWKEDYAGKFKGTDGKNPGYSGFGSVHRAGSPFYDSNIYWGFLSGMGFQNLNYRPGASEWSHFKDPADAPPGESYDGLQMILGGTTDYRNLWGSIQSTLSSKFGNKSYYEIVMHKNGLGSLSDKQAFSLVAAMWESRRRFYSAMTEIYGDWRNIGNDQAMINALESWANDPARGAGADPHNVYALRLFLECQHSALHQLAKFFQPGYYSYYSILDASRFEYFETEIVEGKAEAYRDKLEGDLAEVAWNGDDDDDYLIPYLRKLISIYDDFRSTDFNRFPQSMLTLGSGYRGEYGTTGWDKTMGNNGPNPKSWNRWYSVSAQFNDLNASTLRYGHYYENVWGIHAIGRMAKFSDKDVGMNIAIGVINRMHFRQYKQAKKKYYEIKHELKWEEIRGRSLANKRKAEHKRELQEIAKSKREQVDNLKAMQAKIVENKILAKRGEKKARGRRAGERKKG